MSLQAVNNIFGLNDTVV